MEFRTHRPAGFTPGQHKKCCDQCGKVRLASQMRKQWNNLIVCADTCFEERHPQDFVRGVPDSQRVPDPRPEPEPNFVEPGEIDEGDL